MKRVYSLLTSVVLTAACSRDALSPASPVSLKSALPTFDGGLTVMTRNIYLGADVDPLIAAPPPLVPFVAAETFATIQATDFPARAEALADEIAATNPHLVGLQEVVLLRTQTPGDAAFGGTTPATVVFQDFLEILMDELRARDLEYQVAVVQENVDAEVPTSTGIDVRLTDRDVILVRDDVEFSDPEHAHYTVNQLVLIGGRPLFILRGWTSVVASVGDDTFRFFNTHLEVQSGAAVQVAQATELLAVARAEPLPVIMVGDFNSDAGGTQTPTYGLLTGAGLRDVWLDVHPATPGLTCCHAPDLRNETSILNQRIDLILLGEAFKTRTHAVVVGDEPRDRTPSGLWPSDHAGVVAALRSLRLKPRVGPVATADP